jgi:hypothetical protein
LHPNKPAPNAIFARHFGNENRETILIRFKFRLATIYFAATCAAFAQGMPVSTDGTDPKTWDPKLDAAKAGAKNHKIIFEDKEIRVLSVTVEPGEVEVAHHHQWPSVIVYDRPVKSENRDANGKLLASKMPPPGQRELPMTFRVPPEAAHSVSNLDKVPLHLIRVEFKNGFPKE